MDFRARVWEKYGVVIDIGKYKLIKPDAKGISC